MFYEKEVMNSKSIGKVWRIGHGLNEECDEEVSVVNICRKLDSWVDSTHDEIHRRLSLRTSSILINGAARLHKRKLELLLDDTQRLEKDMSRRKKFRSKIDNESIISQTFTEPEFQDTTDNSDSTVPNEIQSLGSSLLDNTNTINTDRERSHQDISSAVQLTDRVNQTSDKGVQTTPKKRNKTRRFERTLPSHGSFDQNLPFGFVVVHENYHSRVPSRIIFSSCSSDVGKLV